MDCPSCSEPLIVVEREGIELDYCPKCKGLWFDADELELLNEALGLDAALPITAILIIIALIIFIAIRAFIARGISDD